MELQGRRAVVTGGSSGIGFEIARGLAARGARVCLPVRNRSKGVRAARMLDAVADDVTAGWSVELCDLDLARLSSVRKLVADLAADPPELLVVNAGVVTAGSHRRSVTVDGFELNFQTNFLGHAALIMRLLPTMCRPHEAQAESAARLRVVLQCSLAAARTHLDWADLQGEKDFHAFHAYAASKLALGLFGMELARRSRAGGWGVDVQLCHPGITPGSAIAPAIRALVPAAVLRWASAHVGNTPAQAAQTALAAAASDADEVRMYVPGGRLGLTGTPVARAPFDTMMDAEAAARLWEVAGTLVAG